MTATLEDVLVLHEASSGVGKPVGDLSLREACELFESFHVLLAWIWLVEVVLEPLHHVEHCCTREVPSVLWLVLRHKLHCCSCSCLLSSRFFFFFLFACLRLKKSMWRDDFAIKRRDTKFFLFSFLLLVLVLVFVCFGVVLCLFEESTKRRRKGLLMVLLFFFLVSFLCLLAFTTKRKKIKRSMSTFVLLFFFSCCCCCFSVV